MADAFRALARRTFEMPTVDGPTNDWTLLVSLEYRFKVGRGAMWFFNRLAKEQ